MGTSGNDLMIVLVEEKSGWLQLAFLLAPRCCARGAADSRIVTKMSSVIWPEYYSTQELLLFGECSFFKLCSPTMITTLNPTFSLRCCQLYLPWVEPGFPAVGCLLYLPGRLHLLWWERQERPWQQQQSGLPTSGKVWLQNKVVAWHAGEGK